MTGGKKRGKIGKNNEIKDLGDEIYDMDIGDDEWLELCKKFEENSEILLDWMRD